MSKITELNHKERCILVSGISGSGKSTVLKILEDLGFNYVDNLPLEFVAPLCQQHFKQHKQPIVIGLDIKQNVQIDIFQQLLNQREFELISIFLNANIPTLIKRFSETRRKHPLSDPNTTDAINALKENLYREMDYTNPIKELSHLIDTSNLQPEQLQKYLIDLLQINWQQKLILTFQSFAFKKGVPLDCDFLFDARILPNPYYISQLRPLTGKDQPVIHYLNQQAPVLEFKQDIANLLQKWLAKFNAQQRSYVSIAIGCTGGQHRSVYLAEQLAKHFNNQFKTVVRHREQTKI